MKLSIKRAVAWAAGLVTWLFCFVVSNEGLAQTGMTVPARAEVCRAIFWVLWLPFSWIPFPHTIGRGEALLILLLGVPYGVAVSIGLSWLLSARSKKA